MRFLVDKANVPPQRLVASGYGEWSPIASNRSPSGRARNRRIEILLTPALAPKHIGRAKLAEEAKAKPSGAAPAKAAAKTEAKTDAKTDAKPDTKPDTKTTRVADAHAERHKSKK